MASTLRISTFATVLLLVATAAADDKLMKKFFTKFSALETRINALEEENAKLKNEVNDLKLGVGQHVKSRRQNIVDGPALGFTARISSHLTGLGSQHTVVFDSVQSNYGNGYDNVTGYFKAPENGIYVFFANIMSESGNGNEYIETEIVKNGEQLAEMYSGGSALFDSTSNLAVTELMAGDHVWVRVHGAWSSNFAIHCCFSTFSGYLIGYYESEVLPIG